MRLLFVADGRSPIALNWISHFTAQGHEVHLASTYPCRVSLELASLHIVPTAFSEAAGKESGAGSSKDRKRSFLRGAASVRARTALRQWLGLLTIPKGARQLQEIVDSIHPDLVHAMRIPFEGMLASRLRLEQPLLLSIWGNDFTLHARSNPWMATATRRALEAAGALHTDCYRDQRLAQSWGFSSQKPCVVLPGAGGIQLDTFYPPEIPFAGPVVFNPRGIRAYVRNDTFFSSIPLILERKPDARFLCAGMYAEPQALRWLDEYDIAESVELLPKQTRNEMADIFRRSQITVSPATHDGTPNTLLEALACGSFPV
ncbi:MAG: glycosyltransferase, partial [Chloroflexi bacterium]